jgi:high affinity Mn2+ porin
MCAPVVARAQDAAARAGADSATPAPQSWNFHIQNTEIIQGNFGLAARYSGPNSLTAGGQIKETATLDLFAGKRLGRGYELHVDGLLWQGFGLSQTKGIEAFPNADAYKFGTEVPNFTVAHLFIRKTIGFGGKQTDVADDQLTLAGKQDVSRLTITAGRFSATDIEDNNLYASDPHTQFLNWAMVANLTWDYPADAVGYTTGVAFDYNQPKWALRYLWMLMPSEQNDFTGDDRFLMIPPRGGFGPIFKEWGMAAEYERRYSVNRHPGAVRFMAWLNEANMLDTRKATAILVAQGPNADLSAAAGYRYKYGFGLNMEQEIARNLGIFSRLGWNDGHEQPWAYTDANTTASLGISIDGAAWRRSGDAVGLAGVVSGTSGLNQAFLNAGGLGILGGDGKLNYGPETLLETYYNSRLAKHLNLTLDYEFVTNPAFNRDRGPVSILGTRLHFQW